MVALILTVFILIGLGAVDAATRSPVDDGIVSFSAGSFSGDMRFAEIEVAQNPVTLLLSYKLSAGAIDAVLGVLSPDGDVAWSKEITALDITLESAGPVEITLDREGIWQVSLNGTGEAATFDANWRASQNHIQ